MSEMALLEAISAISFKIEKSSPAIPVWHSVLKIEIPVCQDIYGRIFINAFLWWRKNKQINEQGAEVGKEKQIK